jgi:predicted nucleic acid-binding protein
VIFVDTSALYAVLDAADDFHPAARDSWPRVLDARPCVTHGYVLVETAAIVQRRLGVEAVAKLRSEIAPALMCVWVDERLHDSGMTALVAAGRRDVSLVDRVSFEVMRARGVARAFAFDRHFAEEGFELVPGDTD